MPCRINAMDKTKIKIAAIVAAVVVVFAVSSHAVMMLNRQPLLGDEFRDPVLKLSFRPPHGWQQVKVESDLLEVFADRPVHIVSVFEADGGFSRCMLVLMEDERNERLAVWRHELQKQDAAIQKYIIKDNFEYMNDLPVWIYETIEQHSGMPIHRRRVLIDRGDHKVGIFYDGAPDRMKDDAKAIAASMKTVRLE